MRHAGAEALDALEPLLEQLRAVAGLRERKRGTFCRKSQAFLHFHEDPAGLFADLKRNGSWDRFPVGKVADRKALLRAARAALEGK